MSRESEHSCHAVNCHAHVPPRLHMCPRHWRMVPKRLQSALWAAYRPGQERRMDPSVEYLHAAAECVRAVATKENQPPDDIEFEVGLYEAWADMLTDDSDAPASEGTAQMQLGGLGASDDPIAPVQSGGATRVQHGPIGPKEADDAG